MTRITCKAKTRAGRTGHAHTLANGLEDALATLALWGAIKRDLPSHRNRYLQFAKCFRVMGGIGSGCYGGFRAATCEDYHAIDLAWLRR